MLNENNRIPAIKLYTIYFSEVVSKLKLKPINNKEIADFDKFLSENGINLNEIETKKLNWTELQIKVE